MREKLKTLLPLLLLIYIALDSYLKTKNIEICQSTGCKLAGDLLKFDSSYLNFLGMLGAFVLVVLSLIKAKFAKTLYTVILSAMVIFESLLIASQLNLNPQVCKFCLGVYSFLLITLIVTNFRVFLYLIPSIISVFFAFYILAIPKNKVLTKDNGIYLIASKTCPHCKKAKEFLKEKNISYIELNAKDINSFFVAKSLNITQIPILIEKKDKNYQIIVGDKNIIEKFSKKKQKQNSNTIQEQNSITKQEPSYMEQKINYGGNEGCELSITKESNCEGEQ
jgi:glutaredoxin/uncharacterized membrane protein